MRGQVLQCQQFELYAAERSALTGRSFGDVAEMQAFVDSLRDTWWWPRWYAKVARVEVYGRPGTRRESVGSWHPAMNAGKLEMLPVHWNELFVLHELAHVLAAARYGSKSHDPWFARVYLELVQLVMGSDAYLSLHLSFTEQGIDFTPPEPEFDFMASRRMPAAS